MDRHCGSCRYFGEVCMYENDDMDWVPSKWHTCDRIKHCEYAKYLGSPEEEQPEDSAVVVDGSDYYAALRVLDDFGCIYWEEA